MFCSNCGNKLVEGSNFCSGCGNKVGNINQEKQNNVLYSIPVAANTYYEQGNDFLSQNDYDNAINAYKAAIKIAPSFYNAIKELIKIYLLNDDYKLAIKLVDKIINEKPDDAEAFCLRATIYLQDDKYDNALMDLNIAKKIKKDLPDIYSVFGIIYTAQQEWDKAIENYSEAIRLNPKNEKYYLSRGNTYFQANNYNKALEDFNKALSINKYIIEGLYRRGKTLYLLKKFKEALADVTILLKDNQDNYSYLFLNGQICLAMNEYQKATSCFAYCISIMDNDDEYNSLLPFEYHAQACLGMNDFRSIRNDYLSILDIEPNYQFENISIFIDSFTNYYKDSLNIYNSGKKTYVITNKEGDSFVNISLIYQNKGLETLIKNPPIVFINEEHANDYRETPFIHWLRLNKYSIKSGDYYFKQEEKKSRIYLPDRAIKYRTIKNKYNKVPSYWFIIHMPSGNVYHEDKKGNIDFELTEDRFPPKDGNGRFNSIDDAIKKLNNIIKMILERKIRKMDELGIHYIFGSYNERDNYDLRCTDFFIAGSYNEEEIKIFRDAFK